MDITIKESGLSIQKKQFSCDSRPPKLHHNLDWNHATMLVGGPGSGKTTLWLNLITRKNKFYYHMYDKIFIVSPSLKTIKMKLKLPDERISSTFDVDELEERIAGIDDDEHALFIFDDVVSDLHSNMSIVLSLVYNRRHIGAGCSCIFVTQKYTKVPKDIRAAMSSVFMYNKNKVELNALFEEFSNLTKEEWNKVVKKAFTDKHSFLYMRTTEPEERKYHRNFDLMQLKFN